MAKGSITTYTYINFLRCERAGYLLHHSESKEIVIPTSEADIEHFKRKCHELILIEEEQEGTEIIFDKEYKMDANPDSPYEIIVRPNIIIKKPDKCVLVKLKYSTEAYDNYDIKELAFNAYVLKAFGFTFTEFWIISINSSYKIQQSPIKFFSGVSTYHKVTHHMHNVPQILKQLRNKIAGEEIPELRLGTKCVKPKCPFLSHCYPFSKSTLDLKEMKWPKKVMLSWENCVDLNNIPSSAQFTTTQWKEIELLRKDKTTIDKRAINNHLVRIEETRAVVFLNVCYTNCYMPLQEDSRPFNITFFQYDILYFHKNDPDDILEFEGSNPLPMDNDSRIQFMKQFIEDLMIDPKACIITYNREHVLRIIDVLISCFPNKYNELTEIKSRVVGLSDVFTKKFYLNPKLNGSTLMEDVLADLNPGLNFVGSNNDQYETLKKEHLYQNSTEKLNRLIEIGKLMVQGLMGATNYLLELTRK